MITQLANPELSRLPFLPGEPLPSSRHYQCGPNDSSIQRGDREETGDNEARPDEIGSGPGHATVDPTGFGGTTSISHSETDEFDPVAELGDLDGVEVMEANDGRLGLTNVEKKPADDWAADTGPTRSPESRAKK